MKRFISKTLLLSLLVILMCLFEPLFGLYIIRQKYHYPTAGYIRLFKKSNNANNLVIGCSNIEYNIDNASFENEDFLSFAGSQNLTLLQYLAESGYLKKYKIIYLYLPFHFYKNNEFALPINDKSTYVAFLSYEYIKSFIIHHPISIFRNWKAESDSILKYRINPSENPNFISISSSAILDEEKRKSKPDYFTCKNKFNAEFHQINIGKIETDLIVNLFDKQQEVYVIFPPIPNISYNINQVNEAIESLKKEKIKHLMNLPYTLDSSYFFDQWYHANYCGKKVITEDLKRIIVNSSAVNRQPR